MNKTYNRKCMYDYCCQKVISHKEILSRIIQEFVDEAKGMTLEEISGYICDIKMSSLDEYIHLKKKYKQQDICCYFLLKERIEINIYLNLDYIENVQINKRNKHKVYHLYFITRSLEYDDGVILKNRNSKLNVYKIRVYVSNHCQLKEKYKQHNEILYLMHIILNYRMSARYKIRLIKKYIDNKEINRGLEIMCNLSQAIEMDINEKAAKKVTKDVTRKNNKRAIYNVMKNINVSLEVAMDILDIPKSERQYLEDYFK